MKLPWLPKLIGFVMVLLTPLTASAAQPEQNSPGVYRLEMSLFDDGRLVGQPRITVSEGKPVIVTVEKDGGYSMRLVAIRTEGQPQGRRLRLSAEIFFRKGTGWRQVAAPRLTLALGQTATIETRQQGTARTFKLDVLANQASPSAALKSNRP